MSVDKDLVSVQQARDLVEAAHEAQNALAKFDQNRIDRVCEAMAKAALAESLRLGTLAVEETGYGRAEDKREKNRFAAEDVWNYFRTLRTVGVVAETKDVVEIASPRGVITGIIPSTNPTSTAIFKCLIAIKSRNAIVLSPHPSAVRCITETVRVMRDAGLKEGLPPDAVACMTTATIEGTEALMKHKQTAVILATGGIGLVRAAYSSGKPAFGVGPGNVPVFIERTADAGRAVQDVLTGKCFDNGTICASEQAIVVDAPIAQTVRAELERQGAHFLSAAEADKLAQVVVTPQRALNPKIVGKSVEVIAEMADLSVPPGTRCLVAEVGGVGREHPLSMEKLSPILAFYVADGLEQAAAQCFEILSYGGMGHTAGIHTRSREMAIAFGIEMPASRVVVNTPTTHGAIGFSTALPPSMTLGCGSWGGNVTSDNISPFHLMDIKRVAFGVKPVASARPVVQPAAVPNATTATTPVQATSAINRGSAINRDEIARIVDAFLAKRESNGGAANVTTAPLHSAASPAPVQPIVDMVANRSSDTETPAPHAEAAPGVTAENNPNGIVANEPQPSSSSAPATMPSASTNQNDLTPTTINSSTNGHRAVDFVCEEDVRRAVQRGEKIYINARTIITPAARDIGESSEVFAKE